MPYLTTVHHQKVENLTQWLIVIGLVINKIPNFSFWMMTDLKNLSGGFLINDAKGKYTEVQIDELPIGTFPKEILYTVIVNHNSLIAFLAIQFGAMGFQVVAGSDDIVLIRGDEHYVFKF